MSTAMDKLAGEALVSLRKNLLDLSRRNPLLNYRENKRTLKIIDEQPRVIYEYLVNDGKRLTFLATKPIKDEEEGLEKKEKIDDELPTPQKILPPQHTDLYLQTPYLEEALGSRCRTVKGGARSSEIETGESILYLALFFLEWYDSDTSTLLNRAPLILIPVKIEEVKKKKKRGVSFLTYTLEYKDQDIEQNLSLLEKLNTQFNLILPSFDRGIDPEKYAKQVEAVIEGKQRWRVARKMLVGFFSFAKLRMYKDLDQSKWSNTHSIINHNLARAVLVGAENGSGSGSGGMEYGENSDKKEIIDEDIPVVLDADSSQLTAINNVQSGEDLVIEGPPGTGKSQTITNMIATAMLGGKSVLFVAEKMAALDVVKNRLSSVGLGEFCLELHSHKTQRASLVESIKKRKKTKYKDAVSLDEKIIDLKKTRNQLNEYVELINKIAGTTGKSIYEIFWAVEKSSQEMGEKNNDYTFSGALSLSRIEIEERTDIINEMSKLCQQIPVEKIDLWKWFKPYDYFRGQEKSVEECFENIIKKLEEYLYWLKCQQEEFGIPIKDNIKYLRSLGDESLEALTNIPLDYEEKLAEILATPISQDLIDSLDKKLNEYFDQEKRVLDLVGDWIDLPLASLSKAIDLGGFLAERNFSEHTWDDLNLFAEKTENTLDGLESIKNTCAEIMLLIETRKLYSLDDVNQFSACYEHFLNIPNDIETLGVKGLCDSDSGQVFSELKEYSLKLKKSLTEEESYFVLSPIPKSKELEEYVSILKKYDGKKLKIFSTEYRSVSKQIKQILVQNSQFSDKNLITRIALLAEIVKEIESFEKDSKSINKLGTIYDGINTDWIQLGQYIDWSNTLCDLVSSRSIASLIVSDLKSNREKIVNLYKQLKLIINGIESELKGSPISLSDKKTFNNTISEITTLKKNILCFKELADSANLNRLTVKEIIVGCESQILAKEYEGKLDSERKYSSFFKEYYGGIKTNIERFRNNLSWINQISTICSGDEELVTWVLEDKTDSSCKTMYEIITRQNELDLCLANFIEVLSKYGPVNDETLMNVENEGSLIDLINKLKKCKAEEESLVQWADLSRSCKAGERLGLKEFIDLIFNGNVEAKTARSAFEFYLYSSMAIELIREHPSLANFTRVKHCNILDKFSNLDREIIKINRDRLAYKISRKKPPPGTSVGRVSSFTDNGLLNHLMEVKKVMYSIRNIINRSCNAIKAIKPCFMMSPLSVSQYFTPELIDFDLVIMDEASQIKPVDALGAILRGKQVVIVGDSNQLPPTSFFDTLLMMDEEEEEEQTAVAGMKSILNVASNVFMKKILRWHYRSEHENLIRFSNSKFYDDELIVCASPHANGMELGVRSHYIKGAQYKKGRNEFEAQAVVDCIFQHFQKNPELSLGVATFNKEQCDHIQELLLRKTKESDALDKMHKDSLELEEPFFVKNLENVQGDERDVIFISTVYGPDSETGQVYQRFGPIAGPDGWKRLNVIFTRAKKRVELFTSLRPADIREGSSSIGPARLREYIEYAETGILKEVGESKGEAESDFEISVLKILEKNGIKALPQIGVAGFRIDIGVLHPHIENEFILGIECDGATYHSSKIARDRDRLREEILIKKGWKLHRIWSTDWFKNRDHEEERLLNVINELSSKIELVPPKKALEKPIKIDAGFFDKEELKLDQKLDEQLDIEKELRTALTDFRRDEIGEKLDEPSDEGILREEVLDFFVINKPTNMDEFHKRIPIRFREDTKPEHLVLYLAKIFDIVKEYTELSQV